MRAALLVVCAASVLIALSTIAAQAQCSMCKIGVSNSTNAARLAQSLNLATLVMLVPPVIIFCAFFLIAHRKARATRSGKEFGRRQKSDNPPPLASAN